MIKTFKKILCTLLVVLMCLTSVPLSGFVGLGDIAAVSGDSHCGQDCQNGDDHDQLNQGEALSVMPIQGPELFPILFHNFPPKLFQAFACIFSLPVTLSV